MDDYLRKLWDRVAEYITETEDIESAKEIRKRLERLEKDIADVYKNW